MTPWQSVVQAWMADLPKRTVTLIAAATLSLVPGGPASAALLNLPDDVQVKVEQAGKKVPSARQALDGLAQGNAPTLPDREFTPPKSLDEQLGAAKASGKLNLPDPLKTMESAGDAGSKAGNVIEKLQDAVREQLGKTSEAVQENLPGPQDLTPGAVRDSIVGKALTPQSPSVQLQR